MGRGKTAALRRRIHPPGLARAQRSPRHADRMTDLRNATMNVSAPNVDPKEIAKFSALAQSWWDPNGPSKPLHDLNPLRLQYVERALALPGTRILDVGCGGGILSESMARRGARVLGIDLSPAVLEVAELHALESGIAVEYRAIAAEELAREHPGAYDAVT